MATGGTEPDTTTTCPTGSTDEHKQPTFTSPATPGEVYRSRVWEDLRKLFKEDLLTDVMLAADGRSIPCHKVLLAAASKFFHDKFITNPESLEHNILEIDDLEFDTLTSVVSYIYRGNIELTVEKTEKLIPASVSLMVPELTADCKNFLDEKVNSDTADCSAIHKIAKANSLANTADKAWQVLRRNFQEFAVTEAFKDLTESELQEYLRDEELNVASEDPVFEALVTWVRHDLDDRKAKFDGLLQNIKLSHCSLSFLGGVVMTDPLVQSCLQNVAKAMHVQATTPSLHLGTPRKGYPSTKISAKEECAKVGDDTTGVKKVVATEVCAEVADESKRMKRDTLVAVFKNQIWKLHDDEAHWVKEKLSGVKMLPYSAACLAGDDVVLTGGELQNRAHKQCMKLSLSTLNWTVLPDLNEARRSHAAVCVGDTVYVLGGECDCGPMQYAAYAPSGVYGYGPKQYGGHPIASIQYPRDPMVEPMRSVEYLDMQTGAWLRSVSTDMSKPKPSLTAVRYMNTIYVFETYASAKKTCAFDTMTQRWRNKRNMPRYCTDGCSVLYGDRIYVLGGDEKSCMSYDPNQDTWEIHSSCVVDHARGTAVVWKNKILLCGGESTSVIEEYDPRRDTWNKWRHQLPHWIKEHAMFAVKL